MQVFVAQPEDFSPWIHLAAEVEHLFGSMVSKPGFHNALYRNINRGTAFCVREGDGASGTPLLGGILFSPKPPLYKIGWLAVTRKSRRSGVGRMLVEHVFSLVQPPAEITVTTFGPDVKEGQPARKFYEAMGFHPAEAAPDGSEGGSRQIYRRIFR